MYDEQKDEEIEIDLMEVFHLFLKRWWLIIGCGILCAAAAFGFTKAFVTPQYKATSMIYILSKTTSISSAIDLQLGKQLTVDFQTLATSRTVVERVIDDLNLDTTYEELVQQITVTNPSGSQILEISVLDPDPQMACDISNAMSDTTAERVAEVMVTDKPSMVDDAVVPKHPAAPNTLKNTAIAGFIGMVLVMALLLLNYLLDDRLKTEEDIRKYLDLNTLASIPLIKSEKVSKPKKKGSGKKAAK
jgi:capsular polysaccharide biosynthesis protein